MGLRVCLAEDYLLVAWAMRLLVADAGHHVCGIGVCPSTTLRIAHAELPDLALLDIRLERGTSGVDAARRLWSELQIPSIYTTAYARDAERIDGCVGVMMKPYNRRDVCVLLDNIEAVRDGREPEHPWPGQFTLWSLDALQRSSGPRQDAAEPAEATQDAQVAQVAQEPGAD